MARPAPGTIEHARMMRALQARGLKELKEGELSLRDLLRDPPAYFLGCDLWTLLLATPGIGTETARRICERAHSWPHDTLGEMKRIERKLVINELPERIQ